MNKKEIEEIIKLVEQIAKEDYKQFLILKGYMLGVLDKKKVL